MMTHTINHYRIISMIAHFLCGVQYLTGYEELRKVTESCLAATKTAALSVTIDTII